MKKIVAGTLAVLALTASVFAAPKKGQVRYLNFKPEVASVYQELAAAPGFQPFLFCIERVMPYVEDFCTTDNYITSQRIFFAQPFEIVVIGFQFLFVHKCILFHKDKIKY